MKEQVKEVKSQSVSESQATNPWGTETPFRKAQIINRGAKIREYKPASRRFVKEKPLCCSASPEGWRSGFGQETRSAYLDHRGRRGRCSCWALGGMEPADRRAGGANTAVAAVSGIGGGGERDRGRPERRCCRRAGAAARTAAAGLLLPPLPGSNCTAAEGGAH